MTETELQKLLRHFRSLEIGNPELGKQLRVCIEGINDPLVKDLVKRRYLDQQTVPHIMTEVYFSYEWIYRLIKRGIVEATKTWNKQRYTMHEVNKTRKKANKEKGIR